MHLKLRAQVDSDISEGGTFPALLGFQLAHRVYHEVEHFRAGNNAPRPVGAPRRQGLVDSPCFQSTL